MATVNDYTRTTWQTGDVIDATKMNNIETQLDAVTDNARDNGTAPVFSTTKTYAVGEHVLYNGEVYRCKTAVTNAGAWVSSNWVKAYLSSDMEGEVSELKSAFNNALDVSVGTMVYVAQPHETNHSISDNIFTNIAKGTIFHIYSPENVLGFIVRNDDTDIRAWSKDDFVADKDYTALRLLGRKQDSTSISSIISYCGYNVCTDTGYVNNSIKKIADNFASYVSENNKITKKLELRAFSKVPYNLEQNSSVWKHDAGYQGVLIPVEYIKERLILFADTYKIVAVFLKNNTIVAGNAPDACEGTEIIRMSAGEGEKLYRTPSDCRYLYVYISNGNYFNGFGVYVEPYDISTQIARLPALKKHFDVTHVNNYNDYSLQNLPTIAHISDLHEDSSRLKWFAQFCHDNLAMIDHAVCTGDFVIPANATNLEKMVSSFSNIFKVNPVIGNHEKLAGNQSLSDSDLKTIFGLESLYYAINISDSITMIVLDQYDTQDASLRNHDGHYSQTQINWFIAQLKNASSNGKAVIIAMHRPESFPIENNKGFYQRHRQWSDSYVRYYCTGTPIGDIINAWQNASSLNETYTYSDSEDTITVNETFSDENPIFIGYMCGHFHGDYIGYSSKYQNQLVLCITSGATVPYEYGASLNYGSNVSDLPRIVNTYSENAFNVYGIDLTNKYVKVVRIGADINDVMEKREMAFYTFGQSL